MSSSTLGATFYLSTKVLKGWEISKYLSALNSNKNNKNRSHHPILKSLHWLPVHHRIQFKVLLLVYKLLNGIGHLTDLLQKYCPPRPLRSQEQNTLQLKIH